ncbi:MAG: GTP cyclohydrolase I FolE2 [Candidatus Parcubacteria bacterium]|nr:MAG: GTP cyclohydrolase I FolE2 [Candidatus Parcubacteria bacterium]
MINKIFGSLKSLKVRSLKNQKVVSTFQFQPLLEVKGIKNFENIDEKNFVDIPASTPKILFPLPKVGVTNRKHKIQIEDIFEKNKIIEPEVDIEIFFDLPENQRGLHMSRIEKAMQKYQFSRTNLKEYLKNLIKYAAELQNRETGIIKIVFNYEKLIDKNSSGRLAHENIKIIAIGFLNKDEIRYKLGMDVPFMNACPCPQRWSIREAYHYLKSLGLSDKDIYKVINPLNFGSHTNLGTAKLIIEDLKNNITHNEIYKILNKSVLITRELLSGKDEFDFIKEALIKEQFCEDVAREIVKESVESLGKKLDPKSLIELEVEVNESIHFHNLRVEIREKFENIQRELKLIP